MINNFTMPCFEFFVTFYRNLLVFYVYFQISALYGAMYLLEFHVTSVGATLLPVLTDFMNKKLNTLNG